MILIDFVVATPRPLFKQFAAILTIANIGTLHNRTRSNNNIAEACV